jgi:signal transduction histidine kinase
VFLVSGGILKAENVTHFTAKDGLPDNNIRSIIEDADGRILIGTRYGGLAIYDNGQFTKVSSNDSLLSDHIRSMACDSSGRVWLGTSRGPVFIDGKDFHHVGWHNELLGAQVSACGVHPKGFFWFATSNGLTVYQYSNHRLNTKPPPAYITSITVNGEAFDALSLANLSYRQNNCVIEFVGISLRDANAVRYRYRLQGVDSRWSVPTPQRSVTLAALSPGSYSFEVKAINADGVASTVPAAISFTIHPPFWYRWWFIGGMSVALLAAFGSVVRYVSTQRLQRHVQFLEKEKAVQLELERTRERIARDLHDDVASTLGSVVIYSESLKRQMDNMGESAELAERIGSLSQEAQEAIGDIVWSTSPRHDSLKEMLARISDVTSDMCSASGLKYEITMPPILPDAILSNEVRKSLLLIFKEAMNNTVKHAKATSVRVAVTLSDGELRIAIIDDGVGFSPGSNDGVPRGHGLRNMARRAEEIGARFSLQSVPNQGTTIEMLHKMT